MNAAQTDITFTVFPDVWASSKQECQTSWAELIGDIEKPSAYPYKAACPLIKLATFGDQRTVHNSLRHDANILAIFGIEGDYDAEAVSMADAAEKLAFAGIEAILYTSPSHTDQAPRWRVLCPLSRKYLPHERQRYVARLNGVLGGILAPESFNLSQSFYYGRVNGSPYATRRVDGRCIDELEELDSIAIDSAVKQGKSRAEKTKETRDSDPVIARLRERGMVKRERLDGGVDIICPFENSHTAPGGDSATVYFAAHTGGFAKGHFDCKHSHCAHRSDSEFFAAIGNEPRSALNGAATRDLAAQKPAFCESITAAGCSPSGGVDSGRLSADVTCSMNGAELLNDIHEFLGRFVAYPSPHARIAHTLWCAHTHLMDAAESTPRIAFLSPEPGSGKSRA